MPQPEIAAAVRVAADDDRAVLVGVEPCLAAAVAEALDRVGHRLAVVARQVGQHLIDRGASQRRIIELEHPVAAEDVLLERHAQDGLAALAEPGALGLQPFITSGLRLRLHCGFGRRDQLAVTSLFLGGEVGISLRLSSARPGKATAFRASTFCASGGMTTGAPRTPAARPRGSAIEDGALELLALPADDEPAQAGIHDRLCTTSHALASRWSSSKR